MRDREWHTGQYIVEGYPIVEGPGGGGVLAAIFQYRLRQRSGAVGLIHIDAVAGVTPGQLDSGGRQQALVLVNVLAIDHQQRFLVRIGVRAHAITGLEAGRGSGQATAIRRNGAIGITGLFSPHQRQAVTQFGGFLT
ncbi:hypothetical protein D3C85_1201270 [compost metagenome]